MQAPSNRTQVLFCAAGALALVIGFWPKASRVEASAIATPQPTQKITVRGIVPNQPIDSIHIVSVETTSQVDRPATQLGKPGEPFEWVVEIPSVSGEIRIEASHSGRRWPVASMVLLPGCPSLVNIPPLYLPQQLASADRPYKSDFPSAKDSKRPSYQERIKALELYRREQSQSGMPRRMGAKP